MRQTDRERGGGKNVRMTTVIVTSTSQAVNGRDQCAFIPSVCPRCMHLNPLPTSLFRLCFSNAWCSGKTLAFRGTTTRSSDTRLIHGLSVCLLASGATINVFDVNFDAAVSMLYYGACTAVLLLLLLLRSTQTHSLMPLRVRVRVRVRPFLLNSPAYGCLLELTIQLGVIMIGRQAFNNVLEVGVSQPHTQWPPDT